MDERFPDEFITWQHKTFVGIKVDEIFGMDSKTGKVWNELARQIFCEQSENYRIIEHYSTGAPYISGYQGRISLTHTSHFFAVAFLPKTPEQNLEIFNPRTAMGIDAEPFDRSQVLKVRNKFLSEKELTLIKPDNLKENVIAWTAKEALYKAALTPGIDYINSLVINKLPIVVEEPMKWTNDALGEAMILLQSENGVIPQEMTLFSYQSYGCCVTLAFSPKCAKFGKSY